MFSLYYILWTTLVSILPWNVTLVKRNLDSTQNNIHKNPILMYLRGPIYIGYLTYTRIQRTHIIILYLHCKILSLIYLIKKKIEASYIYNFFYTTSIWSTGSSNLVRESILASSGFIPFPITVARIKMWSTYQIQCQSPLDQLTIASYIYNFVYKL
jgi:hypothetical protein